MSISRIRGACALLSLFLTPLYATAQESGRVIEEILVTAEKREASAQETPIALSAFDQDALDARGIDNIEDLQFNTPNLVISHNSQSPVTYAYIRGIGSDQLVAGFDPGVAYHVDGVYVGQPSSMPVDMWDMERVEVLRGPQGTLYGRNTTGGSINVITAGPTDEYESNMDLTLGNYDRFRARAALSGPITDGISGRIAAIVDDSDGYQRNLVDSGTEADVTENWAVRGKLAFELGDSADLVLTAQRFENEGNQGQRKREPFASFVYEDAIPNPGDPRSVGKDHPEKLNLGNNFYSARLTVDLGFANLVSVTGYIENDWFQTMDIDMSSNPVQVQNWEMSTEQFTQEFQLVSNSTGPWTWIVGAFYFDENLSTNYNFTDESIFGFHFFNGGSLDTESTAFYGQASYDMRDSGTPLRFTAGARWTKDEKSIDEFQRIPEFAVNVVGGDDKSWDEWTGKVGADWFVTDDVMAYASISHGYKGGGFSMGQFDSYDPEFVDAYEIGLKSTLYDGRAQVNAAAFYYDYQDLQVNYLLFTSFTTDNAAEATVQGVEVEATLLATDSLTFFVNGNLLDAEYDKYLFTVDPPIVDLSGDKLNRAPESSFNVAAQYDWSLGDSGTVSARADYYWQDEMYLRVQNIPRHRVSSYDTVGARLMWTDASERWVVEAFGDNLTDEDNLRGITVSDGLSTGTPNTFESYHPPRTYGVRVGYRAGG
jgi:iron complex outermembrane receptor protein